VKVGGKGQERRDGVKAGRKDVLRAELAGLRLDGAALDGTAS
jgi:hypothetical protein